MADPYRDRGAPLGPRNPPDPDAAEIVQRFAFWTYVPPILLFALIVGGLLYYFNTRAQEPRPIAAQDEPRPQGTAGERTPSENTPGGHNPDPTLSSPRDELEYRAGKPITRLHDVVKEEARATIGRRVEIDGVEVERVEGPTLFWVRDGSTRLPVVVVLGEPAVRQGQKVRIAGSVERDGDALRIRATRVEPVS